MTYPVRPGSSVVLGLDDEMYHAMPDLSSSQAKALLESPERFAYWRGKRRPDKKEYDVGHAIHKEVLGLGATIVEIPADLLGSNGAISTNAAKQWVEDQRAEGRVPMKADELRPIKEAAQSVLRHPTAAALFSQPGNAEVSVLATDPVTGIDLRARFDYLPYPRRPKAIGVDLKTARDASPRAFAKAVTEYGYDLQQEWYRYVYNLATGEEIDFAFVVVETTAPYLVGHYRLDLDYIEMGRKKGAEARAMFAECERTGFWPGYDPEVQEIKPPFWAVVQYEEQYA